jgi:hypothetical protein
MIPGMHRTRVVSLLSSPATHAALAAACDKQGLELVDMRPALIPTFRVEQGDRVGPFNIKPGTWSLAEIVAQIPGAVASGDDTVVVRDPLMRKVRAYKLAPTRRACPMTPTPQE